MPFFKVKGFEPDADPTELGVLLLCDLMIPTLNGMKSLPQDVDADVDPVPSAVASIQAFQLTDDSIRLIASTEGSASAATSNLYELSTSTWTDQKGAAGPYTATAESRWVFSQYRDTIYAAQPGAQMQKSDSAAFTSVSGAPKALVIANVLDFVMAFNTDDTGLTGMGVYGVSPDRWWCSAAGNPGGGVDSWTADIATQATTGLLTDTPGAILGARKIGSDMAAFKNTSLYLGRYVGAPRVWDWRLVPGEGLGTWSHYGIVDVEGIGLLFIGYDNIYSFDGIRATPIGTNRVAQFLFDTMDIEKANNIVGFHHRQDWLVYWFFPSSNSGALDRFLCYNYRSGTWGYGQKSVNFAFEYLEPGTSYDGLGTLFATYDNLPSAAYEVAFTSKSTLKPAVVGTDRLVNKLEGVGSDSSLKTSFLGTDATVTSMTRVRPRFKVAPATGEQDHLYTDVLGQVVTTSVAGITLQQGSFDYVHSARWHQLVHRYTGDMELLGFDVEAATDSQE